MSSLLLVIPIAGLVAIYFMAIRHERPGSSKAAPSL